MPIWLFVLVLIWSGVAWGACDTLQEFQNLQGEILNSPNAETKTCITPFLSAGASTNDNEIAACLNIVRAGNAVPDTAVRKAAFLLAIDVNEYSTMTLQQQNGIQLFVGQADTLNLADPTARTQLARLFPQNANASFPNLIPAPISRAAIGALQTRDGSRGESICGTATTVTANNVATAFGR